MIKQFSIQHSFPIFPHQLTIVSVTLLLGFGLGWHSTQAQAQTSTAIQVQQFRPSFDPKGMFQTDSAEALGNLRPLFGTALHYSWKPLFLEAGEAGEHIDILRYQLGFDLALGIGFFSFWDLMVILPMTLHQEGAVPRLDMLGVTAGRSLTGYALGDLKIRTKLQPFRQSRHGVNIAILLGLGVFTGNEQAFNGEEDLSFTGAFLLSRRFRRVEFAVNIGYRYLPGSKFLDLMVGQELFYHLGWSFGLVPRRFDLIVELNGVVGLYDGPVQANSPMGVLMGGRIYPSASRNFAFHVGVGMGVLKGYGSPAFRAFLGLVWRPGSKRTRSRRRGRWYRKRRWRRKRKRRRFTQRRRVKQRRRRTKQTLLDQDGDGIPNRYDRCPELPGRRRWKGCPRKVLVKLSARKRRIYILRSVSFRRDKRKREQLHPKSQYMLRQVASLMLSYPKMKIRLTVTTHSRGRRRWAQKRSWRLARIMKRYLRKQGISKRRILLQGLHRHNKRRGIRTHYRIDILTL